MDDLDRERHEAAYFLMSAARTPAEREYWRGYVSGVSRRMTGGAPDDDMEVVAHDLLRDAPDGLAQLLGQGYRDGLEGKPIAL